MPRFRSVLFGFTAVTLSALVVAVDHTSAEAFLPRINIIDRIAGDGAAESDGDGGPALAASVKAPTSVAVAADGDIYIADENRVRRVDATTKTITTVAGTGVWGFGGDGGPATRATLAGVAAITLDASENLYIVGFLRDRIRRVDAATGMIETYAGGGMESSEGAFRTKAYLNNIYTMDIDSGGRVYFSQNNDLYSVDPASGIVSHVLILPTFWVDVAIDSKGRVYYVNGSGPMLTLDVWDPATGTSTLPTSVPSTFNLNESLTVDRATDTLYIADGDTYHAVPSRSRIYAVDLTTKAEYHVAGIDTVGTSGDRGPALHAAIQPFSITVSPSGKLYLASKATNGVRVISCGAPTGAGYSVRLCL